MIKKIFLSLLLTVEVVSMGYACSCKSNKHFLKSISKAHTVGLVKVNKFLSYDEIQDEAVAMSMEIEVIEMFKGELNSNKTIVWGDNGVLCRPYLSSFFKEGHCYIIGLFPASDGSKGYVHKSEKPEDFIISSCGYYWLNIDFKKSIAYGMINSNKREMDLGKLKKKLIRKFKRN